MRRDGEREEKKPIIIGETAEALPSDPLDEAMQLKEQGRTDLAAAHLLQAWIGGWREPYAADCLLDLLQEAGQWDAAVSVAETAVAERPDSAHFRHRLGEVLRLAGRVEVAVETLREAAYLAPDSAAILLSYGRALLDLENYPDAVAALQRCLRCDPDCAEAHALAGEAWVALGMADRAGRSFQTALMLDPEDRAGTALRLARLNALPPPDRAPPAYVRYLFDQYAPTFDQQLLETLDYRGPELLATAARALSLPEGGLSILDLGCGTGLCGAAFRSKAAWLEGVDLSPGMIAEAGRRGIYDRLHTTDIVAFLGETTRRYDLIVAGDVLNYFGDLAPVLAVVRSVLVPEGGFLFSLEKGDDAAFRLAPSRRFVHAVAYVHDEIEAAGFSVSSFDEDAVIRMEARRPVPAIIAALKRTPDPDR
ncbi:MAG: hypothetical protein CMM50_02180 [Rhodospirillaceae bacterium]|nr:hypothetical protein [Rhodospirillaceae bacterium]